jgi:hypothetical protein
MGEGECFLGTVTQGGARSSLTLSYFLKPRSGFLEWRSAGRIGRLAVMGVMGPMGLMFRGRDSGKDEDED